MTLEMNIDIEHPPSGGDIGEYIRNGLPESSGSSKDNAARQSLLRTILAAGGVTLLLGTGSDMAVAQPADFTTYTSPTFQTAPVVKYVVVAPQHQPLEYTTALTMPVSEQAKQVLSVLSLTKSQLADILGITRPTLYSWLDGSSPHPDNSDRLLTLLRIMANAKIDRTTRLNARVVRNPISSDGISLVDVLRKEEWDQKKIEDMLKNIARLSAEIVERANEKSKRRKARGYSESSVSQQKANLAQNISSLIDHEKY